MFGSVAGLTQLLTQRTGDSAGQLVTQVPASAELGRQASIDKQTVAQLPQWAGSVVVSMHAFPHWVEVAFMQPDLQDRCSQTSTAPHAARQAPQLAGSDLTSTQVFPPSAAVHTVESVPASGQLKLQIPFSQTSFEAQGGPQVPASVLPQCFGSVSSTVHSPSQLVVPALHLQTLLSQICPLRQALPHAPQFLESAVGSMQPWPQRTVPVWQTIPVSGQPASNSAALARQSNLSDFTGEAPWKTKWLTKG